MAKDISNKLAWVFVAAALGYSALSDGLNDEYTPLPDATSEDLAEARKLGAQNRPAQAHTNGTSGAREYFEKYAGYYTKKQSDKVFREMCLSTLRFEDYDTSKLTSEQKKLYQAIDTMAMSPTARELLKQAADKDVNICMNKLLPANVLANYIPYFYLVNVKNLSYNSIAHELRHHWQGEHNQLFFFREELSYAQALEALLMVESDAIVFGTIVEAEIKAAREIGGNGYKASFEEIEDRVGTDDLKTRLREIYAAQFSNQGWLNAYAGGFIMDGSQRRRSRESSAEVTGYMTAKDYPVVGHAYGYNGYMAEELRELTELTANDFLYKYNLPELQNYERPDYYIVNTYAPVAPTPK
jgi:hypothetical protein